MFQILMNAARTMVDVPTIVRTLTVPSTVAVTTVTESEWMEWHVKV